MKKFLQLLAVVVIVAAAAWGVGRVPSTEQSVNESALDRISKAGVLRCAYIVYPPETIKDPNTGKLSGVVVETTEEVARLLGWKVNWVAEVGFQDMFEGFKTGRYDALCSGLYENPPRAKVSLFTIPFNYGATYTFVRTDDTRFDDSLSAINSPDVKIAQIDGEIGQAIADESFPKAGRYSLPNNSDISQVLESVATKKADVAFLQIAPAQGFIEHNPGKLKILRKTPARAFPAPLMALPHGEQDLKAALDAALRALQENGFVERILRKYDANLDSYILVAKPYQTK
ncbi:MAG: transporter substrate-binding domain-containing protein [Alphaproteobacteria bacterium]|nr:transporter substrate-binding domain-containing protein [Alphaproteobacteria bacterium]